MLATRAIITLVPWLTVASCFAPTPPAASSWMPRATPTTVARPCDGTITNTNQRRSRKSLSSSLIILQLSQSVNDISSGFHYDQEPRGTSFISQVSQQDLYERRQMRGPRSSQARQRDRRAAPNSRGAGGGGGAPPPIQQQQFARGTPPPQQQQQQFDPPPRPPPPQYYDNQNNNNNNGPTISNNNNINNDNDRGGQFNDFQDNVSVNLKSMTDLLREMQMSQSIQSTDVQSLTLKVADMADRITKTEAAKNQMVRNNQDIMGENKEVSFGTSLDGEFHQKINDVVDEFNMVGRETAIAGGVGVGYPQNDDYYRSRIAQLDAKIDTIDDALRATEEKFNTQMEYVDMLVNQRLDDIDNGAPLGLFDGIRQFEQMPPPESMMQDGPPPHMHEFPPPPPPPPQHIQEGYDNNNNNNPYAADDGLSYYQERNYNVPNVPPPPSQEIISSSQKTQSEGQRSVNTRSGGHHFNEKNNSFISAFSKADNDRRKEFQPFNRDNNARSRSQIQQGGEQVLHRGVRGPPNRRMAMPPPEPMLPPQRMEMGMEMGMEMEEPYFEERPYFYEDGPGPGGGPMMEDDYYYYDDMNMYEF